MDLFHQNRTVMDEAQEAIRQIAVRSDYILGATVADFEAAFAGYLGCRHVIGVSSGTEALALSVRALRPRPGDEVLVPAFGFAATAEAVILGGAIPVFTDVDRQNLNIDVSSAERMLSDRTIAIIAVHLYGRPAELTSLRHLAESRGLALIEDAAQAHGAVFGTEKIGTLGTLGCFSFYPTKNLGAWGDAGAVATNDKELADEIRSLRHHGQVEKNHHLAIGTTGRLDSVQAAVLSLKLRHLDRWNEERRRLAAQYEQALPPDLRAAHESNGVAQPVWHLYVIQCRARASLARWLHARGVATAVHYPYAISDLPPFQECRRDGNCPVAAAAASLVLSLPLYPGMAPSAVDFVAEAVREWAGSVHES
jgi:dTDP-4-amino-4,6-dideoxygalactose transaminase